MADYQSAYTGKQIDEAVAKTNANETAISSLESRTKNLEDTKVNVNTGAFDPTSDNPAGQKSIAGAMEKLDQNLRDTIVSNIPNNSITSVKLNDEVYGIISNDGFHFNLMSRVARQTIGQYITVRGAIISAFSWKVSDYIDVSDNDTLKMKLVVNNPAFIDFFCLYDSDKNVIKFNFDDIVVSGTDGIRVCSLPKKTKFIRINSFRDEAKNFTDGNFACLYRSEKYAYKYGDSIEKPYDFTGKKLLAFGDSITWGVSSPNLAVIRDSYIRLFADKFGMTLNNKAVSGSTITNTEGSTDSIYYVVTHTTDDTDFIIVAGGVNDYALERTVGSYGDTDPLTFYGAMHGICEYFKTSYPGKPVIFITPVNVTVNKNNVPMDRLNLYRNAIYEVATSYGYDVVNGIDMIPVDGQGGWNNTMIADSDGIHPTASGHVLYFRNLCGKIENLKESVNTGTFDPTSDNPAGQKSTAEALVSKDDYYAHYALYRFSDVTFPYAPAFNAAIYQFLDATAIDGMFWNMKINSGKNNLIIPSFKKRVRSCYHAFANLTEDSNVISFTIGSNEFQDAGEIFEMSSSLENVKAADGAVVKFIGDFAYSFGNCTNLVEIGSFDLSEVTSLDGTFVNCYHLKHIHLKNFPVSFNISYSIQFEQSDIVEILNNLMDLTGKTSQTLTMGATNLAKLTDEEKAIATNKNWVLA